MKDMRKRGNKNSEYYSTMKTLILIFLSTLLLSCSSTKENSQIEKSIIENNKYGNELIKEDFLKFANTQKIDSVKIEIINSFDIYNEETYKFASIDAEELAEFNFEFFLPQLNKILEKRNVTLTVKTTNDYETTSNILVNNERINLYTKQELDNKTFWDAAPRNFFKKVNEILKSNNSDEKFYLLYGGNDLSTLLLTEKQFQIIKNYYKNNPKDIPYLP